MTFKCVLLANNQPANVIRIILAVPRYILQFYGKCDVLVNCSSMGSVELFGDKSFNPTRGHMIRVCTLITFSMSSSQTAHTTSTNLSFLSGLIEIRSISISFDFITNDKNWQYYYALVQIGVL